MAEKKKIHWLLILQGWAMLWVVIGHAGPSPTKDDFPPYALFLHDFAYSFHMPLFIAISGFLFYLTRLSSKKWKYWPMLKEKLVRFGIPFLVFTIFGMVLKSVFSGSIDRATTISLSEFANAILYPYNGPMREFWFLATIMWYFALFPVWKLVLRYKWLSVVVLLGLAALSIWHPNSDFLAISHASLHAFFFYGGILCATLYEKNADIVIKNGFAPISFLAGVCLYIVGRLWDIPLVTPLGGAGFSLAIALWLDRINPKTFFTFRDYTYQIYLLGIFFNVIISILRTKFGWPFGPMYIVSMILGLYMPVLISKLLEWFNWKPLLLCVGLKQKNHK